MEQIYFKDYLTVGCVTFFLFAVLPIIWHAVNRGSV